MVDGPVWRGPTPIELHERVIDVVTLAAMEVLVDGGRMPATARALQAASVWERSLLVGSMTTFAALLARGWAEAAGVDVNEILARFRFERRETGQLCCCPEVGVSRSWLCNLCAGGNHRECRDRRQGNG